MSDIINIHYGVVQMINYSPFINMNSQETAELRGCMCNEVKLYRKGDIIMQLPDYQDYICIVDKGVSHLVRIDINGTKSIIDYYEESDVFGAIFSPDTSSDTFYVIAKENCTVTFINYNKLLTRCDKNCDKHLRFLNNIILTANEKAQLHIDVLSQRSTRAKLMTYLRYLDKINNGNVIQLPLSLSDLANYLAVDRSAMMREIKKMNDENIISSNGNSVTVKNIGYGF